MATQFSDMALGGSGFAAGYTPIRFAPLVSLTGPIQGPATPTAPEAAAPQAPMIRPPMVDQGGGYEGMGPAFTGEPIGTRMATPAGRQAELANLANAAGFLASPFTAMANYVLTGQSPAQAFGVGDWRAAQGPAQQGLMPQGGMSGMFGGLRDFLFGPQQQSVPLGDMRSLAGAGNEGLASAVFNDAFSFASNAGVSDAFANQAGDTALSLFSQGIDPATAVAMAVQAAQMDMATLPDMTQNAPTPGLAAMNQTLAQFAQGGPAAVAPGAFAVGMGPTESSYDFSSSGYGGGTAGETGAPGESSYGLDR